MKTLFCTSCSDCHYQFQITELGDHLALSLSCERCQREAYVQLAQIRSLCEQYQARMEELQAAQEADPSDAAPEPDGGQRRKELERAYQRDVEATLEPCVCGGRYRLRAAVRCPNCGSTRYGMFSAEDAYAV